MLTPEERLVKTLGEMLALPDFLLPLASAQGQFRRHYYGLNAAALLEDLFYDTLGSYLKRSAPYVNLSRPKAGQKGWDYEFDGVKFSHKVAQKLIEIAALWDATVKADVWTIDEPIVYALGETVPARTLPLTTWDGSVIPTMPLSIFGSSAILGGRTVFMVQWPADGSLGTHVLKTYTPTIDASVADALPFDEVWSDVLMSTGNVVPLNHVEFLVSTRPLKPAALASANSPAPPGKYAHVGAQVRGGIYVFDRAELKDLPVTSNNRAILVPKDVVRTLIDSAVARDAFVPLPEWYGVWAADTPPDMYVAQRAEFDRRFSVRGGH